MDELVGLLFLLMLAAIAVTVALSAFTVVVLLALAVVALLLPGIVVGFVQGVRDARRDEDPDNE